MMRFKGFGSSLLPKLSLSVELAQRVRCYWLSLIPQTSEELHTHV